MSDPRLIYSNRMHDERGWFSCVWRKNEALLKVAEENHSYSAKAGTLRGLHWQAPQQAKLLRVLSGIILDACVRLSDGKTWTFEISAEQGIALYVPDGFAHGFCTLTDGVAVSYQVSSPFAPHAQYTVDAFDPMFAIAWPVSREAAIMSEKDRAAPGWAKIAA